MPLSRLHEALSPRALRSHCALGALSLALVATAPLRGQCDPPFDLLPGAGDSAPNNLCSVLGDTLLFTARDASLGVELWVMRPGFAAPVLLQDINSGAGSSTPEGFTEVCTSVGPRVFFYAVDGLGANLWMTDGTTGGTVRVKDIAPGGGLSGVLGGNPFAAVGERLFFTANGGTFGPELWVSDGTDAGTFLVADIRPGGGGSQPAVLTRLDDDRVVFTAFTAAEGRELWVSDGTQAGTFLLGDIRSGSSSPSITSMVGFDGRVFFGANDGSAGNELWVTDGTVAGTQMLADINMNSGSSFPNEYLVAGDELFFSATSFFEGTELWKTDGTPAGTVMVANINSGTQSSDPRDLVHSAGRVFFSAFTGPEGREVWTSDGTAAGTVLADIETGLGSSFPSEFAGAGDGVLMRALSASGAELWFSDGTAAGSFQLCDPDPAGSSEVNQLVINGGELFFVARTPATGIELFRAPLPGASHKILPGASRDGNPRLETVGAEHPVLGDTFTIRSSSPTGGGIGLMYLGPVQRGFAPLPIFVQGGCDQVGFLAATALEVFSVNTPDLVLPVPVPNDPMLVGAGAQLQVLWVDFTHSPAVQTTNGLQIWFGNGTP